MQAESFFGLHQRPCFAEPGLFPVRQSNSGTWRYYLDALWLAAII